MIKLFSFLMANNILVLDHDNNYADWHLDHYDHVHDHYNNDTDNGINECLKVYHNDM